MAHEKHEEFVVRQVSPYNGEPPRSRLLAERVTPIPLFFARCHAPVPDVDPDAYRLIVDGLVERPLRLTLAEVVERFPARTVEATLQCAGNRRLQLMAHAEVPGEVPWDDQAIGNAVWSGASLADVLAAAEVRPGAAHVGFTGLDRCGRASEPFGFGGSVPLEQALGGDVILAHEMNGAPLPPVHGGPLRVVAPGSIGARSVKWIERIEVRNEPSDNHYQARAYRLFPPDVGPDTVDWESGAMLGELDVNSVIDSPCEGDVLPAGSSVPVTGWAISGGGRRVETIEVSPDGGATWVAARRRDGETPASAWTRWEAELTLDAGPHEMIVRAVDSDERRQPERVEDVWNFKGYMNNCLHRVHVVAE